MRFACFSIDIESIVKRKIIKGFREHLVNLYQVCTITAWINHRHKLMRLKGSSSMRCSREQTLFYILSEDNLSNPWYPKELLMNRDFSFISLYPLQWQKLLPRKGECLSTTSILSWKDLSMGHRSFFLLTMGTSISSKDIFMGTKNADDPKLTRIYYDTNPRDFNLLHKAWGID